MRKFRHKKTGEVAREFPDYYRTSFWNIFSDIPKRFVENSDDWEEVIKRDFEILSFYTPESDSILHRKANNLFVHGEGNGYYSEEDLLSGDKRRMDLWDCDSFDYVIHSVRRFSDGEVFTLGDKAKDSRYGFIGTINKFKINGGSIYVSSKENVWGQDLSNLIKYEEPKVLFQTLDGIDLKHGDKFYVVDTKFFKIFEAEAGITFKTEKWIKNSYHNKELAERWIDLNRPKYSIKDMLIVVNNWSMSRIDEYDVLNFIKKNENTKN